MVTSQDRTRVASQATDMVDALAGTRLAPLADIRPNDEFYELGR